MPFKEAPCSGFAGSGASVVFKRSVFQCSKAWNTPWNTLFFVFSPTYTDVFQCSKIFRQKLLFFCFFDSCFFTFFIYFFYKFFGTLEHIEIYI